MASSGRVRSANGVLLDYCMWVSTQCLVVVARNQRFQGSRLSRYPVRYAALAIPVDFLRSLSDCSLQKKDFKSNKMPGSRWLLRPAAKRVRGVRSRVLLFALLQNLLLCEVIELKSLLFCPLLLRELAAVVSASNLIFCICSDHSSFVVLWQTLDSRV